MRSRSTLSVAVLAALTLCGLAAPVGLADVRCGVLACRGDMSVSGHAEPQPIYVGETSELKLTPQNNGPDGVLEVDLQVVVPQGLHAVHGAAEAAEHLRPEDLAGPSGWPG